MRQNSDKKPTQCVFATEQEGLNFETLAFLYAGRNRNFIKVIQAISVPLLSLGILIKIAISSLRIWFQAT